MTKMDERGNIYHTSGETFNLKLNVLEDDVPIDFANWHIELKIFNSTGEIKILNETEGIDISVPGWLIIKMPPSELQLPIGTYYYDLKVTRPNGDIEVWLNNNKFIVE
jgi:hypothetical protein